MMQVLDILTWWKFKYGTYSINSYISPPLSSTKGEVALAILKYMQVFITWSYIFITTYKHKSIARFLGSIMAIQHLLHVQDCTCFSLHVLTSKSFLPFVYVEKKGEIDGQKILIIIQANLQNHVMISRKFKKDMIHSINPFNRAKKLYNQGSWLKYINIIDQVMIHDSS